MLSIALIIFQISKLPTLHQSLPFLILSKKQPTPHMIDTMGVNTFGFWEVIVGDDASMSRADFNRLVC
jgi:hypothetical protein